MDFLKGIFNYFCDSAYFLKRKPKILLTYAATFVIGVLCGVLFSRGRGFWSVGRANYVTFVVCKGSFWGLTFRCFVKSIFVCAVDVALSQTYFLRSAKRYLPILYGLFCGSYAFWSIRDFAFGGTLYFLLIFFVEQLTFVCVSLLSEQDAPCCQRNGIFETLQTNFAAYLLLAVQLIWQICVNFIILRNVIAAI